jgi:hypothetical protein
MGHSIGPTSVRKLRAEIDFSRLVNRKADEGASCSDRSFSSCVLSSVYQMSDSPFDTVHGLPTRPYRVRVLMLSCSQMRLAYSLSPETQRTRMQDNNC